MFSFGQHSSIKRSGPSSYRPLSPAMPPQLTSASARGPSPNDYVFDTDLSLFLKGEQAGKIHWWDVSNPASHHWSCGEWPLSTSVAMPGAMPVAMPAATPVAMPAAMPVAASAAPAVRAAPGPAIHLLGHVAGVPPPPGAFPDRFPGQAQDQPHAQMEQPQACQESEASQRNQGITQDHWRRAVGESETWPATHRQLFVGNLPGNITEAQIRNVCRQCGTTEEPLELDFVRINQPGTRSQQVSAKIQVCQPARAHMQALVKELHGHL